MQNQDALPGIVILVFSFLLSGWHCQLLPQIIYVNAADNKVGSKIVVPLNLFEISEIFLFSIVTKEK